MLTAYHFADSVLHIVAKQRGKGALFRVKGLGSSLDRKKRLLVKIFYSQACAVRNGLVLAVPLPEQAVQQPLVDLPQLAQSKGIPGGCQSCKGCVCVLLTCGFGWLLVHRIALHSKKKGHTGRNPCALLRENIHSTV